MPHEKLSIEVQCSVSHSTGIKFRSRYHSSPGGSVVRTSDLEFGWSRVRFSPGAGKFSLPRVSIVSPYAKRKIFPGVYVCCSLVLKLVYLNGNNAAEGENINWTVKNWFVQGLYNTSNWFVQYFKKGMVTTQMSGVITRRTMFLFERLEKVYIPDEDSLEQRINIFHGQLYSIYRDNRKFRLPLQLFFFIKSSRSDNERNQNK